VASLGKDYQSIVALRETTTTNERSAVLRVSYVTVLQEKNIDMYLGYLNSHVFAVGRRISESTMMSSGKSCVPWHIHRSALIRQLLGGWFFSVSETPIEESC
jgi:hypothetical protein